MVVSCDVHLACKGGSGLAKRKGFRSRPRAGGQGESQESIWLVLFVFEKHKK